MPSLARRAQSELQRKYTLHEELGKGAYAVVRRATPKDKTHLDSIAAPEVRKRSPSEASRARPLSVAIKTIDRSALADDDASDVEREINIMREINHERGAAVRGDRRAVAPAPRARAVHRRRALRPHHRAREVHRARRARRDGEHLLGARVPARTTSPTATSSPRTCCSQRRPTTRRSSSPTSASRGRASTR